MQKELDALKSKKQEMTDKKTGAIREETKKEMDKLEQKRIAAIEKKAKPFI